MTRATTSSSNLLRRQLCPGSERLEHGLPEQESEFSAEGTMLHALYMTSERPAHLTEEQCTALDCADRVTLEFFARFRDQAGIPDDAPFVQHRELELRFRGDHGAEFPGHADIIRMWPDYQCAAIADAKFGFGQVDEAPDNLQLASYAVMFSQQSAASPIGVCIAQPRNFGPKSSSAIYSMHGIGAAHHEIEEIVMRAQEAGAPLNPSEDACRYCKAKLICPALTGRVLSLTEGAPLTTKTAPDYLAALADDRLGYILDSIKLATMLDKHAKAEARKRIEAGQMPEWMLKQGAEQKEVTDTLCAFSLLQDAVPDLTGEEYMRACTLSREALKKPLALLLKCPQNRAEQLILDVLDPVIERTRNAPSVVRK